MSLTPLSSDGQTASSIDDCDYFSIESIIASHERISCKFEQTLTNMGFLDASSESRDILPGTKLELPFWLTKPLQANNVIRVDVPKSYGITQREILNADATVVAMSQLSPHFYEFGLSLRHLGYPDYDDISTTLLQTFRTRFRMIMDNAQNSVHNTGFCGRLDLSEAELLRRGRKSLFKFIQWEKRIAHKITPSETVENHKKRKRAALDSS